MESPHSRSNSGSRCSTHSLLVAVQAVGDPMPDLRDLRGAGRPAVTTRVGLTVRDSLVVQKWSGEEQGRQGRQVFSPSHLATLLQNLATLLPKVGDLAQK